MFVNITMYYSWDSREQDGIVTSFSSSLNEYFTLFNWFLSAIMS